MFEPLVLLHGFLDSPRTWDLVRPVLERSFDVLAPALPGHAGGPPIEGELHDGLLADAVERELDAAGLAVAHIAGNSLGGHVALQLAARGRAKSVTAFAPAGGWAPMDRSYRETLSIQAGMHDALKAVATFADAIVATPEGRRRATSFITTNYEHIPADLLADLIRSAAACEDAPRLIEFAAEHEWTLDAERITCPVRVVWGSADKLLPWPSAAVRYREEWLPHADWVVLDGVGHCPQLDVPLEAAGLISA